MKKFTVVLLALMLLTFSACDQANESVTSSENLNLVIEDLSVDVEYPSKDYSSSSVGNSSIINEEEVTITESGVYEFSGEYKNITVNVDKTVDEGMVYLVLEDTNITSENGTPINIIEAKDVVLVLKGENIVTQGEIITNDTEFPSAAIYSRADTAITGSGSLTVKTQYQDGINSRDDLVIESGNIVVEAVEDGVVGKDLLAIADANIDIICGKDGLKASNDEDIDRGNIIIKNGDFGINASNDAISAEQILQIENGVFDIYSGNGFEKVLNTVNPGRGNEDVDNENDLLEASMKGLKSSDILINGGEFNISSYEDAVHADANLQINGGSFLINSGDDAIHGEQNLVINSVDLTIENGYEGIESSVILINGGNISLNVLDDGINANTSGGLVKITNGNILIVCEGDGIDSNGDLFVEGGEVIIDRIEGQSGGDSELDIDGVYIVSGGSVTDEDLEKLEVESRGKGDKKR